MDATLQNFEERVAAIVRRELAVSRPDRWHNRASAAEHIRLSIEHFNRLDRAGKVAGHGAGRMRRWRESALDSFMEGRANAA